jgi:hypothetical protein
MVELALQRQLNHNKKRKFHSAEGPCFKRATSLCEQINRIWYNQARSTKKRSQQLNLEVLENRRGLRNRTIPVAQPSSVVRQADQ